MARTGTEAGTGTEGETSVEGCRKDSLVVVEEKVVLVIVEVLVKMGEVDDEGKEEDVEDGTGEENMGSFITRSNSSPSSDSLSITSLLVASAHALSLASSTVSFPWLMVVVRKGKVTHSTAQGWLLGRNTSAGSTGTLLGLGRQTHC